MSVHVIYYENGAKMMRPVLTREEYLKLRSLTPALPKREGVQPTAEEIAKWKRSLVQMNYSCLPGTHAKDAKTAKGASQSEVSADELSAKEKEGSKVGPLRGACCVSNSVGMDIDLDPNLDPNPKEVEETILAKKVELGLLMLERSATKGFHIVFRRHPEMSQEENLKWASLLLGVEFDKGAKDITRVFFTPPISHLIYLDDELFSLTPALSKGEGEGKTDSPVESADQQEGEKMSPNGDSNCSLFTLPSSLTYNGIPYSDIVSKYWELFNDGKEPCEGNRNTLTFELAMVMRHICGFDKELMNKVIPDYWTPRPPLGGGLTPAQSTPTNVTSAVEMLPLKGDGGSEKLACIDSALREERKGMPYRLRQVMLALKKENGVKATGGTVSAPPPMPKRLPKLIQLLTKNVPWYYRPAVSSAVFPALATHLHGVKFRYWDNVEHEATFMNVLVGRQSIGKGSIKKPIEYIMADIQERDKIGRAREAEWKRLNPPGKTKKDPRPTDICIQMLIDNLTDAVFNQRVADVDANGQRYIYTIVDEIEALKKVTSRGTIDEVMLLIRKAFDNSLHGQERVGAESVTGIAPLRWNWNASTTPPNVRKFFHKGVSDGTVGRLDIATIMAPNSSTQEGEDGSHEDKEEDDAPIMGIYDEQFAQELKPYLDRLEAANGLIECPQSTTLALEMRRENKEVARLYDSEAYLVYSYRANVIAWLKGMLLYIAQGYKWDKTISDFVRWTEKYNLWCKMLYFGTQLEDELHEEDQIQHQSGPQNLLDLLGDEFSKEEYRQMRASQGKKGDGDSTLRTWQSRGYIVWDDISSKYHKTEAYLKRKRA